MLKYRITLTLHVGRNTFQRDIGVALLNILNKDDSNTFCCACASTFRSSQTPASVRITFQMWNPNFI